MTYTTLVSTSELALLIGEAHATVASTEGELVEASLVVVDCRHNLTDADAGERAYRDARVPGAQFMHIDRDLSGVKTGRNGRHPLPDITAFAARIQDSGIGQTTQVVAYDQNNGMWASRLWWLLRWLGHDAVAVLDGGLDKWLAEGRPVAKGIAVPDARAPRVVSRMAPAVKAKPAIETASAEEILRSLNAVPSLMVLDARAPERYRGDIEPIDPVAGHIPGALNRPYTANLSHDGTFKPAELLRAEFLRQLGDTPASAVVHQCGSGVTACHNVLAMTIAGLPGSRLYPGSWSEWVADPARPVARDDQPAR